MATRPRRSVQSTDLRDQPAYTLAEAARYLKLPAATLRSWVAGRPYPKAEGVGRFQPLIHPPSPQPPILTFWNLIFPVAAVVELTVDSTTIVLP